MGYGELTFLALGLAMDAFAVSVCKGLALDRVTLGKALVPGMWFGAFQGGMPLVGWALGAKFAGYVTAVDHWIAFFLLVFLGGGMLREARCREEPDPSLAFWAMLALAVATSIDALAVGVTFAFLSVEILPAVGLIGGVTFLLSAAGVFLGGLFGEGLQGRAKVLGGVLLILLGGKLLLGHLFPLGLV